MGKQINYWLGREEFLHIAQAALDCGCVIIKPGPGKTEYGQTLDIITEDSRRYYFYLPEAGSLMAQKIPFPDGQMIGYNAAGSCWDKSILMKKINNGMVKYVEDEGINYERLHFEFRLLWSAKFTQSFIGSKV